jgi:hypothetical protein
MKRHPKKKRPSRTRSPWIKIEGGEETATAGPKRTTRSRQLGVDESEPWPFLLIEGNEETDYSTPTNRAQANGPRARTIARRRGHEV